MGHALAHDSSCCVVDEEVENEIDVKNPMTLEGLSYMNTYQGSRLRDLVSFEVTDDTDSSDTNSERIVESLTYSAESFDETSTVDLERSHARYSKILTHSLRGEFRPRERGWENWLLCSAAGRAITLLLPQPKIGNVNSVPSYDKIRAMSYFDRHLNTLTFVPTEADKLLAIQLPVACVETFCPAAQMRGTIGMELSKSDKLRALLIQYISPETMTGMVNISSKEPGGGRRKRKRNRICFLVETEQAMQRFLHAFMPLWLEKRNGHFTQL